MFKYSPLSFLAAAAVLLCSFRGIPPQEDSSGFVCVTDVIPDAILEMRRGEDLDDVRMKESFYPELDKSVLIPQEYVARRSSHTRGSAVDLTLVDIRTGRDLDMGTVFDYFGRASHPVLLPGEPAGAHEPYPDTYFTFPIRTPLNCL